MKKNRFCKVMILVVLFMMTIALSAKAEKPEIKVGVFDGHGGAQTCIWETVEALRLDAGMSVSTLTSAQIAAGGLDKLDVLVIPGGSGSRQYLNLGAQNRDRIRRFIESGKGAVGICAGAYLFTSTPGYPSMGLNGNQAIDIEHDNRGHGLVRFSLTREGQALFPELADRSINYLFYYEGPVLVDAPDNQLYTVLARMESDVHEEGNAPAGMTMYKPFFVANEYGKGRVFSSIAHPEATPGMRWMVPRMVRWAARREIVQYEAAWIQPGLFNSEILFSQAMLKKEADLLQILLLGRPDEKVEALDWLESNLSWDARRWVQGLLYDESQAVRERARQYILNNELTMYRLDLDASRGKLERLE